MPKQNRVYLFSKSYPRGFLHEDISNDELADLLESGWYDHPSKVPGAPEEMSNLTGGDTRTRGGRPPEVRYSNEDLRAMYLSGKELNRTQIARIVSFLELELPEGADDETIRNVLDNALREPTTGAGAATTASDVRKLEGAGAAGEAKKAAPKPLKPAGEGDKAPAKKAAKKAPAKK